MELTCRTATPKENAHPLLAHLLLLQFLITLHVAAVSKAPRSRKCIERGCDDDDGGGGQGWQMLHFFFFYSDVTESEDVKYRKISESEFLSKFLTC